jgi:hypothetical protein
MKSATYRRSEIARDGLLLLSGQFETRERAWQKSRSAFRPRIGRAPLAFDAAYAGGNRCFYRKGVDQFIR